jgi:hypothetical protein|tara:strand:+ start:314 stop:520 length:207 start_codon:yes stop_codon:yes gene_type:complete
MVTFDTWEIGEGYHKVHIRNEEVYTKIKSFLSLKNDTYYYRDGETFAWDIIVNKKQLAKVKKILKEFT